MEDPQTFDVDKARVNELMRAFRYGEKVDDLEKVDARYNSGQYDWVTWMVALDGSTLAGFSKEFRKNLEAALRNGDSDIEAEEYAYNTTADYAGIER